jgi:hypothetical protein
MAGPKPLPRLSGPESNFLLGSSRKAVIDAALGTSQYQNLPEALRKVMPESVWQDLSKGERVHLAAIYNRMQTYGLWDHVSKVVGVKERPEADAHVPGVGDFAVEGSSGAFLFETAAPDALYEGIFAAGFGTDTGIEGSSHAGQTSTRESTSGQHTAEVAAPDGLHISLGPGNQFDAHVDRISPTNPAQGGRTQLDVERGWVHHRHEYHGDKARDLHRAAADYIEKKTGLEVPFVDVDLAGVAGGPTLDPSRATQPEDRNNPTAPIMVDITLRGPRGKE